MNLKRVMFKSEMPATRMSSVTNRHLNAEKDPDLEMTLLEDGILITGCRKQGPIVAPMGNVSWYEPYPVEDKPRKPRKPRKPKAAAVPVPETAMDDSDHQVEPPAEITEL